MSARWHAAPPARSRGAQLRTVVRGALEVVAILIAAAIIVLGLSLNGIEPPHG